MNENREIKLDNLKAIIIILIVFTNAIFSYHFHNSYVVMNIVKFIYSFIMPLFCIITGYQSRNNHYSKQLIKLFGLFMIMNYSFYLYEYIIMGFIDSTIIKYTSWYVIDLIIWRLLYKQIKNKKMAYVMCIIGVTLLSVIPNNFNIFNIDMLLFYFSFFLLGSFDIFDEDDKNKRLALTKIILCFLVIIICMLVFKYDYRFLTVLYNDKSSLIIVRVILYACSYIIARNSYIAIPDKDIKIFTNIGRCSLGIYFFHTILTMIFSDLLHDNRFIPIIGLFYALFLCILIGNGYVNKVLKFIMDLFLQWYSWIALVLIIGASVLVYWFANNEITLKEEITTYNVINNENIADIKNRSISIGSIGNIMLLEEQIKNSYHDSRYNFDYMFKYINSYLNDTDYMIANVVGVSDDRNAYTYGDSKNSQSKINVPSALFSSLSNNNFKLINIGNQFMMAYGENSLFKTLDNIERNKLNYVGAYKEREENPKIVDINGINVGILSYSYMSPKMSEDVIFYDYDYINKFLCSEKSKRFDRTKEKIKKEFKYLKDQGADVIIVMPSNNLENSHEVQEMQKLWNKIFMEYGADIIIGNYSNNMQSIKYIGNTLVINSTGSFINNKNGEDNDLSVMTKIYIDKERKNVNAVSIIPLYSYKNNTNGYYSLPIYEALTNDSVYSTLSQTDIDRMKNGIKVTTKTMFGKEIDILEDEYFYFVDGYKRREVKGLEFNKDEEKSNVYKLISNSKTTCYVGDYYTTGGNNGGFGWYEPIVSSFGNNKVVIAEDEMTANEASRNYYEQMHNSNCDLFVVAIGSNDIRKKELNVDNYIYDMERLLKDLNKDIIVIAPWQPIEFEYSDNKVYIKDMELFDVYNKRLKKLCDENKYVFVNPNNYIKNTLSSNYIGRYYNDDFFINNSKGIELFSKSIFNS